MNAYLRLMRFDKPIGIYLLLWPTLWALWISANAHPAFSNVVVFILGVILMRAAGCIMNDIADRKIDPHVKRTKNRPLASGEIKFSYAVGLFFLTLTLSASLLFFLPINCFYLAIIGGALTVVYPFCKRFLPTPQMVLGLAFSWGIPMAYAASHSHLSLDMLLLLGLTYLWIVVYDTMYAMSDKADDIKLGVHSTAIFLGRKDKTVIAVFQILILFTWLYLGYLKDFGLMFYVISLLGSLFFLYQQYLIKDRDPDNCFKAFLNNHWYGLVMWIAVLFALK